MSSQQPVDKQGRPLYKTLSFVNPDSAVTEFVMVDLQFPLTHLTFDEQRAQYRAEQEQEQGQQEAQQEQEGGQGGENASNEEVEQDDAPFAYPLPSSAAPSIFGSSSSTGAALASPYTPEEQMARRRAEQAKQRLQEDKDQQGEAARE